MNAETDVCLESVFPLPRPAATRSTLRVAGRGSPGLCPPGGGAILPPARHSLPHRNNLLLDLLKGHIHSLFESALLYALLRNQLRNFVGLLRDLWDRHVNDLLLNLRHWNSDNDQVHQAHLINATKDNVPTPIRANKTYRKRLTENRHMSMRIAANVRPELEQTAGLTYLARYNMKNKYMTSTPATPDDFAVSPTSPSSRNEASS